jgi:hypothetical protein
LGPAADALFKKIDPDGLVVEAGNMLKRFTAGRFEIIGAFHANFFKGLQAVSDKRWGYNNQAFFPFAGESLEFKISVRGNPWLAGDA